MKKRLLILGIVVALVAALVVPMAVSAAGPTTTGTLSVPGTVTATTAPIITTPIYAGTTTVSGTAPAGSTITVTIPGVVGSPFTTTATGGGTWSITVPALSPSDSISVTAQLSPNVTSTPASYTVPAATASLTVPSNFAWIVGGSSSSINSTTLGVGYNEGSATAGSVVSAGNNTWTLSVADANQSTYTGHMTTGAPATGDLAAAIQVDMSPIIIDTPADTIAHYASELAGTSTTGNVYGQGIGTFNIPFYAGQTLAASDPAGSYSITINYVLAPAY